MTFNEFFAAATNVENQAPCVPHQWQSELASSALCFNRLIRIPTGMGKTLGVLLAWAYHRVKEKDANWPTRLVWCLPMRTLVEQTANETRQALERTGLSAMVDVHCLMGGIDETDWAAQPETPAVLIGTQDMLLSRALNRGYAMGRASWPRAFGLINCDALWVMDEIQLMGVGLTSSAQIQAFWEIYRTLVSEWSSAPRATWWMSATLQPDWLSSPETEPLLPSLKSAILTVALQERRGALWDAQKPVRISADSIDSCAEQIVKAHASHLPDPFTGRQTLIVVNTVKRAKELFTTVESQFKSAESRPELRLVHSRFRPYERKSWASEFLSRQTLSPTVNRILIATQVVEAGVDISASCLMTDLAPWPCLVQRFGRAARYGGSAEIIVFDWNPTDEKKSLPYSLNELNAAREALKMVTGVSIRDLEVFESDLAASDPETLQALYPFQPLHVLMQHEFEELFDTSPDLSGADMDISRFIREGNDERDVQIFWRNWDEMRPSPDIQPLRDELCTVSIVDAKIWIKKVVTVEKGMVWYWDYVDGRWNTARAENLRPGIVLLVAAKIGGYDPLFGFTGDKLKKGQESLDIRGKLDSLPQPDSFQAELQEVSERASFGTVASGWKTIYTHCKEAAEVGRTLATSLNLSPRCVGLIELALRLHDWGKAHPSFSTGTYRSSPTRTDLAKAPKDAWRAVSKFYETNTHGPRPGFRHELASCLATLELLRLANPRHQALQDGYGGVLQFRKFKNAELMLQDAQPETAQNAIAVELNDLGFEDFNLLLYLIASHHGKVRLSLQASTRDQDFRDDQPEFQGVGMPIRGVRDGDIIPPTDLPSVGGTVVHLPPIALSLTAASMGLSAEYGASWSERTLSLVSSFGPFLLGYLEAIVRAVDGRASALPTADPLLDEVALTVPANDAIESVVEAEVPDFGLVETTSGETELEDSNA